MPESVTNLGIIRALDSPLKVVRSNGLFLLKSEKIT